MEEPKANLGKTLWVVALVIVSTAALTVSLVAPPPLSKWGALIVVTTASSLIALRSASAIFNPQIAGKILPYAVATFLVLSVGLFFVPGSAGIIAGVVLFSIDGIALFYGMVAWVVKRFSKPR